MRMTEPNTGDTAADTLVLVGTSVRRLRISRGISVAELARSAGVSRRMLTSIETGTANTSLVTLDKIARALGVGFPELVRPQRDTPIEVIAADAATVLWSGAGRSAGRVFTQTTAVGSAELWDWALDPGDRYVAKPDPPGSEEILLVIAGMLTLDVDGVRATVPLGAAARIASDRPYSYLNETSEPTSFARVVVINR